MSTTTNNLAFTCKQSLTHLIDSAIYIAIYSFALFVVLSYFTIWLFFRILHLVFDVATFQFSELFSFTNIFDVTLIIIIALIVLCIYELNYWVKNYKRLKFMVENCREDMINSLSNPSMLLL
uniref:Uncharacterized protein n=1 Tax=viral metagenome TaxID=1070528 RepID=A0A6C0CQL5_9ZZZZ